MEKNASIHGKKLSAYNEAEIRSLELEDLIEVEQEIKDEIKRKEESKQIRLFRNKDYIAREFRTKLTEIAVKKAKESKIDFAEVKKTI